jgi:hypothetical protein
MLIWSHTGRNLAFSALTCRVRDSPGKSLFLSTIEEHRIPERLSLLQRFVPIVIPKTRNARMVRSL